MSKTQAYILLLIWIVLSLAIGIKWSYGYQYDFNSVIDITEVSQTNEEWRITGDIINTTPDLFSAYQISVSNIYYCLRVYTNGINIDKFRVTSIVTSAVDSVVMIVTNITTDTNATPQFGHCYISSESGGVAISPSETVISELLRRGINTDISKSIASRIPTNSDVGFWGIINGKITLLSGGNTDAFWATNSAGQIILKGIL